MSNKQESPPVSIDQWSSNVSLQARLTAETSLAIKQGYSAEEQAAALFEYVFAWKEQLIHRHAYALQRESFCRLVDELILLFPCDIYRHLFHRFSLEEINTLRHDFSSLDECLNSLEDMPAIPSGETMDEWAGKWLARPHFTMYKSRIESLPQEDRRELQHFIFSRLERHVYHLPSRRTFFQLVIYHGQWEKGLAVWQETAPDPLKLTREERSFFQSLAEFKPNAALPAFIQLIEQLIEKKQLPAYESAVRWLASLHKISEETYFHAYITLLKQKYKAYRSFIQELEKRGFNQ